VLDRRSNSHRAETTHVRAAAPTDTIAGMPWQEVGDRVFTWRFEFFDQQIGVILGGSDVAVIDTRSTPVQAREIADAVRELTRDPVSIVIDTHWHFDHTFGNHTFRPATIWGHARVVDRLRTLGRERLDEVAREIPAIAGDVREVVIDPPDRTFAERATVEVGDRAVELAYLGRAHTDTDITITVSDADVLFAGDLLEEGATPSFGDSYPIEWPAAVARLLPLVSGAVIPGHGAVGDRAFVESQLADLRALASLAQRVHAGELDLEAAIAASPYSPETSRSPLERALRQLRGELD
jgi:glyoxylase-like metal-dependent hydrolase (beta-lactamase superfamily II)